MEKCAKFDSQKCKQFVDQIFANQIIHQLSELVKIPNTSKDYDPQWKTNGLLEQAALHIKTYLDKVQIKGMTSQIIQHEGYTPLLFTQVEGSQELKNRTVLFYGHFDKQPSVDQKWDEGKGQTIPVYQNERLYGRGTCDDGYSVYSAVAAIKAVKMQGIPIPRCIIITEGDQQSGGHIQYYLEKLKDRIGNLELIFCLDSGAYDYDRVWITNSIRGYIECLLTVKNLKEGVHSGDSSGVVPSVFRIANLIVQKLQNLQTGKIHDAFTVDIPANRYKQTSDFVKIVGDRPVRLVPLLEGVEYCQKSQLQNMLNGSWRPQLTVTGISKLPQVNRAGNVMIPQITLRLSLRTPPTLQINKATQKFKQLLTQNIPYNAQVQISQLSSAPGWNSPTLAKWIDDALAQSSQIYFGNKTGCFGQGGSVPFMGLLSEIWPKANCLITGVCGPDSNAHGPNQFLDVPFCKKLTQCFAHIISKMSQN